MRHLEAPMTAPQTYRVASVDALRGFNIFWILGADGIIWSLDEMSRGKGPVLSAIGSFLGTQMTHVEWEGFRFYDFIFPLFIFVSGVAIALSLPRLVEREGKVQAHVRVLRRALLLYGLGLIYLRWHQSALDRHPLSRRAATYRALLSIRIASISEFPCARDRRGAGHAAGRLLGVDDVRAGARDRRRLFRTERQFGNLD